MLPVPEIALNLIGKQLVRGWVDLHGGYNNRLWRVFCDGEAWIVKSFRTAWLRQNEMLAIDRLGPLGIAPSTVHAQSATVLIWPDDGLCPVPVLDEGGGRSMGYALRQIHDSGPVAATDEERAWRTVNRIGDRVGRELAYRGERWGPVHGDACLGNCLGDAAGRFVRFSDFEEFGEGDQAADLIQCLVETACDDPARADQTIAWVLAGYAGIGETARLPELADKGVRVALGKVALSELMAWARMQDETDLLKRYQDGYAATVDAIAALPPDRFA